ncbi:MAG TPA: S8 family serine peptidase [Actinocrinis sp.]|jgi:subtilisin family serine protease
MNQAAMGRGRLTRAGVAVAAAALTVGGAGVWSALPAAAASGAGTGLLAGASGCTTQSPDITAAQNQGSAPWEISLADPQKLAGAGATGSGVNVAIIDTGLASTNAQVDHNNVTKGAVFSGISGNYQADVDGHGTMVASIIAAQKTSQNGMQGIAPDVNLMIYREAGCDAPDGGPTEGNLAQAINQAVSDGAQIINISQDGFTDDASLKAAVQNAYNNNVLIVVASGNDASDTPSASATSYGRDPATFPASYAPDVLAVGAVDQSGQVGSFSETGPYVGVTAPGVGVGALFPDDKVEVDSGTSFAAPYVTAVAALVLQKHPNLQPSAVMQILESTASGNGSWNSSNGWGEVNVQAALAADPQHLNGLYGAGPNANGAASEAPTTQAPGMLPIVASPPDPVAAEQRHEAYAALGSAGVAVVLVVVISLVVVDARRRRGMDQEK